MFGGGVRFAKKERSVLETCKWKPLFSVDFPNLKFLFISFFSSHISMLLHRYPMPKHLVRCVKSPSISCQKNYLLNDLSLQYCKLRKPSLVLLYNRWIRQDRSQTNLNDWKNNAEQTQQNIASPNANAQHSTEKSRGYSTTIEQGVVPLPNY